MIDSLIFKHFMENKKTTKPKGGKRPGAGRKKASHTIAAEKAREVMIERIAKELQPLLDAQIDLAKGISIIGKNGKVYEKEPDGNMLKYLLDQLAGKAKESIDIKHTGMSLKDMYKKSKDE